MQENTHKLPVFQNMQLSSYCKLTGKLQQDLYMLNNNSFILLGMLISSLFMFMCIALCVKCFGSIKLDVAILKTSK